MRKRIHYWYVYYIIPCNAVIIIQVNILLHIRIGKLSFYYV